MYLQEEKKLTNQIFFILRQPTCVAQRVQHYISLMLPKVRSGFTLKLLYYAHLKIDPWNDLTRFFEKFVKTQLVNMHG